MIEIRDAEVINGFIAKEPSINIATISRENQFYIKQYRKNNYNYSNNYNNNYNNIICSNIDYTSISHKNIQIQTSNQSSIDSDDNQNDRLINHIKNIKIKSNIRFDMNSIQALINEDK